MSLDRVSHPLVCCLYLRVSEKDAISSKWLGDFCHFLLDFVQKAESSTDSGDGSLDKDEDGVDGSSEDAPVLPPSEEDDSCDSSEEGPAAFKVADAFYEDLKDFLVVEGTVQKIRRSKIEKFD